MRLWLSVVVAAIVIPSGFVVMVDPFGYFGTNTAGFYYSSERQFKQTLVRTANYNAILLGDSRIAYTDPSMIPLPEYKWLNGGIAGSTLSEQIDILFDAQLDRLDLVVIGLTAGALGNGAGCLDSPERDVSPWDVIRHAASWTQLWYAVQTLLNAADGIPPYYHRDGTRTVADKIINDDVLSGEKSPRYWAMVEREAAVQNALPPHRRPVTFAGACLRLMEQAQALAKQYEFRLIAVFLPLNRDFLDRVEDHTALLGSSETQAAFDQLRAITPDVAVFLDSAHSDSANFWLHDPTHFKPEVGARMIEEAIRATF